MLKLVYVLQALRGFFRDRRWPVVYERKTAAGKFRAAVSRIILPDENIILVCRPLLIKDRGA